MAHHDDDEEVGWFTLITTYLGYAVLIFFGRVRDWSGWATGRSRYHDELNSASSGGLVAGWERFYTRRLFNRIQDCWARPVVSRPSIWIDVAERRFANRGMETDWSKHQRILNLGSYNYLGFADENWDATCGTEVRRTLDQFGVAISRGLCTRESKLLEQEVAAFVGKEDAVLFNTGYITNAWALTKLMSKGGLIVSDSLNHTSIVNGCRASGAKVITFAHNDAKDLARVVSLALTQGGELPTKILVVVEGLYSMEGHVCELQPIVKVCKEMKLALYIDEAHSIGACGPTGRGICELKQVPPSQVDVLMGTFTKSFGGLGGYVAGSSAMCNMLRTQMTDMQPMSPVVCSQIRQALYLLRETQLGKDKLRQLKENSMFFRQELIKMGCSVLGDEDSPIVPVMLYHPAKIAAFSRECLKHNLAVVVVGAPAVPLMGARVRFCLSASHKRQDLVYALREIRQVAIKLNIRYGRSTFG
ncbi:hypothetical protein BASA81_003366 [Batrachochytrium salamandrivorans]|nr:hypothetical protein BASA81_003366 [Batrachochytrium salamandrivorans]